MCVAAQDLVASLAEELHGLRRRHAGEGVVVGSEEHTMLRQHALALALPPLRFLLLVDGRHGTMGRCLWDHPPTTLSSPLMYWTRTTTPRPPALLTPQIVSDQRFQIMCFATPRLRVAVAVEQSLSRVAGGGGRRA